MGTNSVTTTDLSYWFYVSTKEKFVLLFTTKQLGATELAAKDTLANEVAAGAALAAIRNHRQAIAIVNERNSVAVHRLFTLPHTEKDLRIRISLFKDETERHVEMGGDNIYTWHPEVVEHTTSKSLAELVLNGCQLLSMKPDAGDSYIATFKMNGGFEMDYGDGS